MSKGSKKVRNIESSSSTDSLMEEATSQAMDAQHAAHADQSAAISPNDVMEANASLEPSLLDDELDDPRSVALSEPFVTRWSVLVSTTNWEKGAIICAWREELSAQNAPITAYSDEAWSRRVGGVTSQHVGRLRRVYQRFGQSQSTYERLYWTHFLAALDWDDAEMWLEGASQTKWSVSEMRRMRWQANGGDPQSEPDAELVASALDDDFVPGSDPLAKAHDEGQTRDSREISEGPRYDGPDFGDEGEEASSAVATADDEEVPFDVPGDDFVPPDSPFANLPALPVDLAEALEQFKLAIIRHRASQWEEIARDDILRTIDALRVFATL